MVGLEGSPLGAEPKQVGVFELSNKFPKKRGGGSWHRTQEELCLSFPRVGVLDRSRGDRFLVGEW